MHVGHRIGIPSIALSGGFLPTDVNGVILWLRADDPEIIVTGAGVSTWPNPQGQDALQTTDADRPALVPGGWSNGRQTVDFDLANTEWMDLTGLSDTSQGYTFFAAVDQRTITTVLQYAVSCLDSGGIDWGPQFITNTSSTVGALDVATHRQLGAAQAGQQILCWAFNGVGDTVTAYRNGTQIGTAAFTSAATLSSTVTLCSYRSPAAGQMFNGELGEMIIYNQLLSDGDRSQVTNYLLSRWP